MPQLNCIVTTPEKTALETRCTFIVLPLFDGEIGIAPGRAPLIGRLGFGEMRITHGSETTRYFLDGGFVQVSGNVVSILTDNVVPAQDLDVQAARDQLAASLKMPIATAELERVRDHNIDQARARLRTARRR